MNRVADIRPASSRAGLEPLEERLALAGDITVTAYSGQLQIKGDSAGNVLHVEQQTDGRFLVTGSEGTTINGVSGAKFFASGVKSVTANLGGGNDRITIDRVGDTQASVPLHVSVNLGSGSDKATMRVKTALLNLVAHDLGNTANFVNDAANTILIEGQGAAGNPSINRLQLSAVGSVLVRDLAIGSADLDVGRTARIQRTTFHAYLDIDGSDLDDTIVLDQVRIKNGSLAASCVIASGFGNDCITLRGVTVDGWASIYGGPGHDKVEIYDSQFGADLGVYQGPGNDRLTAKNTVSATKLIFDGGSGDDTFQNLGGLSPKPTLRSYEHRI